MQCTGKTGGMSGGNYIMFNFIRKYWKNEENILNHIVYRLLRRVSVNRLTNSDRMDSSSVFHTSLG